jgi:hypothetical protein
MENKQNRSPSRFAWPDQTLPRKPSPLGLEQQGRGRAQRNTALRARRRENRDVITISKTAKSAPSYWKMILRQVCHSLSLEDFRHEF